MGTPGHLLFTSHTAGDEIKNDASIHLGFLRHRCKLLFVTDFLSMRFLSLVILIFGVSLPGNWCSLKKWKGELPSRDRNNIDERSKEVAWVLMSLANGDLTREIPKPLENLPACDHADRNDLIDLRPIGKTKAISSRRSSTTNSDFSGSSQDNSSILIDCNTSRPLKIKLKVYCSDNRLVDTPVQNPSAKKTQAISITKKDLTEKKQGPKKMQVGSATKKNLTAKKQIPKKIQNSSTTKKDTKAKKQSSENPKSTKNIRTKSKAKNSINSQTKAPKKLMPIGEKPSGVLSDLVENLKGSKILRKGLAIASGYFSTICASSKARARFAIINHNNGLSTIINGFFITTVKAEKIEEKSQTFHNYYTRCIRPLSLSSMEGNQLYEASEDVGLYAHIVKGKNILQVVNPPLAETLLIVKGDQMKNVTEVGEYPMENNDLVILIPLKLEEEQLKITANDAEESIFTKIYDLWKVEGVVVKYKTK